MEKTPFWKKSWFIILMFLVFPLVGIVLMWAAKKSWNKAIKIVSSVIFGFFAFGWMIILFAPSSDSTTSDITDITTEESTTIYVDTSTTQEKTTDLSTTAAESTTLKPITTAEQTTVTSTTTEKETTTAKPTTTEKVTTTTKPTTTQKVTTTTKHTTTKAPSVMDYDSKVTVYITPTGSKYHYENPCGNGSYSPISLSEAKAMGLTACKKCVLQ